MKNNFLLLAAATFLSLSISACGASLYESSAWEPPDAETDWDVDSLVCEQRAAKRELTEEEEERRDQATESIASASTGSSGDPNLDLLVGATAGLLGGMTASNIESSVKDDEFRECLKERGWSKK